MTVNGDVSTGCLSTNRAACAQRLCSLLLLNVTDSVITFHTKLPAGDSGGACQEQMCMA
jgi:hypothetical protein